MTEQAGQYTTGSAGQSPLRTIPQAAALLGKSERTLRRWVTSGKLNTVSVGGQVYIQPEDLHKLAGTLGIMPGDTPGADRPKEAEVSVIVQDLPDKLEQAYKDRIEGLQGEVQWLRQDNQAKQATIDNLTRMLPAPQGSAAQASAQGKGFWYWFWLVAAVLGVAGALTVLVLWIFFPPRKVKAQPIKQPPAKVRVLKIGEA